MAHEPLQQEVYLIIIKGHLDSSWSTWFDGLTIVQGNNGETVLFGPLPDQTALHGLLNKVRDLGLPLLSVQHVEPDADNVLM